jgi:hypothetical protein
MMLIRAQVARYGRQNRSFGETATEREKKQDWLAVDAVSCELFSCPIPC